MNFMAEIFISYKSDRRNAAKHLSTILNRYGYSVWFDYALIKGDDFDFQLDQQLRAAKAVIVLWCSMSVESAWVSREASLAAKLKTFLPVLIEDCELKLAHHTSDYVDLSRWDGSPRSHSLDPLLREVGRLVGRPPHADWAKLSEYEEDWRMFGSPNLAAFALGKPVEAPALALQANLMALAAQEWPAVRDSGDVDRLRRFELHFAGTYYAGEARVLRDTLEAQELKKKSASQGKSDAHAEAKTDPPVREKPQPDELQAAAFSKESPNESPVDAGVRRQDVGTTKSQPLNSGAVEPLLGIVRVGNDPEAISVAPNGSSSPAAPGVQVPGLAQRTIEIVWRLGRSLFGTATPASGREDVLRTIVTSPGWWWRSLLGVVAVVFLIPASATVTLWSAGAAWAGDTPGSWHAPLIALFFGCLGATAIFFVLGGLASKRQRVLLSLFFTLGAFSGPLIYARAFNWGPNLSDAQIHPMLELPIPVGLLSVLLYLCLKGQVSWLRPFLLSIYFAGVLVGRYHAWTYLDHQHVALDAVVVWSFVAGLPMLLIGLLVYRPEQQFSVSRYLMACALYVCLALTARFVPGLDLDFAWFFIGSVIPLPVVWIALRMAIFQKQPESRMKMETA
jgi:hypothetical protein